MPTHKRSHSVTRAVEGRHRRVLEIAKEVSATIGSDFLNSVARHLASSLNVDCVYIAALTEAPSAPIRPLSFCNRSENEVGFEQGLGGTAAGQVLTDGAFSCARDARRYFPLDTLLDQLQAEAYTGIRLCGSATHPLGLIAVISRHPDRGNALTNSVLEAFVPRVAAEVERKVSDDALRQSEERYRAFVQCNSDAMWRIEFERPIAIGLGDEETVNQIYRLGYVAECNGATATLFGRESPDALVGTRLDDIAPRTDSHIQKELRDWVRSGFRSSTVETMRHDERDGIRYRLRTLLGIVNDGRLLRIWGSTRDVTDRR
jgi:PAS domain-containing protein